MNAVPHYLLLTAALTAMLGKKRAWIGILLSLLFWLPFQPHFIGIFRGAVGELSVGSWILTILIALGFVRDKPIMNSPGLRQTAATISVLGILLYGNFIGFLPLGSYYLYEGAFGTPLVVIGLSIFGVLASWRGWLWPALWVILTLLVWLLKLHPSLNPWDILIDPVLWIASIIALLRNSRS